MDSDTAVAERLERLPKPVLTLLIEVLRSLHDANGSLITDRKTGLFELKPIFGHNFLVFVFLYGLLALIGVYLNGCFIWRVIKLKLHQRSLHYFLLHMAVTHFLAASLIVPGSLTVLLSRYWIFGGFACYAVTMLQDLPSRTVLLLLVLVAVDRYRRFAYHSLDVLPRHGSVVGVWLISGCLGLPASAFVEYHDLYSLVDLESLRGMGLCVVNIHSMEEYARGMFVALYVVPLAVCAFAFTRVSIELSRQHQPVLLAQICFQESSGGGGGGSVTAAETCESDAEALVIQPDSERSVQRYLAVCGLAVAASSLPLNIMSVLQFGLREDYANASAVYDITYAVLVWISLLPVILVPVICLAMMSSLNCVVCYRRSKTATTIVVDTSAVGHRRRSPIIDDIVVIDRSSVNGSPFQLRHQQQQNCSFGDNAKFMTLSAAARRFDDEPQSLTSKLSA